MIRAGAVLDMLEAIQRAERLSKGLGEAEFTRDELVERAVFSQILVLGEAELLRQLSALMDAGTTLGGPLTE